MHITRQEVTNLIKLALWKKGRAIKAIQEDITIKADDKENYISIIENDDAYMAENQFNWMDTFARDEFMEILYEIYGKELNEGI